MIGAVFHLVNSQTITTTNTYTSGTVNIMQYNVGLGVWYKITSGSSQDIKIEYELSYDDDTNHFVAPDNTPDIVTNLTNTNKHVRYLTPFPMKFLRIKVTGNSGNTSATLDLFLVMQERL